MYPKGDSGSEQNISRFFDEDARISLCFSTMEREYQGYEKIKEVLPFMGRLLRKVRQEVLTPTGSKTDTRQLLIALENGCNLMLLWTKQSQTLGGTYFCRIN